MMESQCRRAMRWCASQTRQGMMARSKIIFDEKGVRCVVWTVDTFAAAHLNIYIYIGTAKVASTVCYRRQRRGLPLTLHIHMPSCRTDMASPHRNPLLICVYMFGVPFLSDSLAFLFFYVYLRTHKMRIYMDINTAYAFLFPCRHAHISASRFQGLTFADVRLFGCQSLCLLMCECVHSYESKSTIKLKI